MRKKVLAANWKMNLTLGKGVSLGEQIVQGVQILPSDNCKIILCPSFLHLTKIYKLIHESNAIELGAQNCYEENSGAFTGEISVEMLKSCGVDFVIIGHSERRQYFNESNLSLAKKVSKVIEFGLQPIFCCGETLSTREANQQLSLVQRQIESGVFHLSEEDIQGVVIAYEPVWAIGTGLTATPEQAQEMHQFIRSKLADRYKPEIADNISIVYGGSCKPSNAETLFAQPDVDGGLIGGASLKSEDFLGILDYLKVA